jgi:hypothetical protein
MSLWERDILAEQATVFLPGLLHPEVELELPQAQRDIAASLLPGVSATVVSRGGEG